MAKGQRHPTLCPACGAVMFPARLLRGYDKTGPEADRPTCALHGPLGRFRHIATDRAPFTQAEMDAAVEPHVDNEGYEIPR